MPERYCSVLELRKPTNGYEFAALPPVYGAVYLLATKLVLSRWRDANYSTAKEFVRGGKIQGGLSNGQRSVAHDGLSGDVVFNSPCVPNMATAGALMRIGSSMTWAPRACFGGTSMGVRLDNGTTVAPGVGGYFQTTGSCVMADLMSLDLPLVPKYTLGRAGSLYRDLQYGGARGTTKFSYIYRVENWRANMAPGGSWNTAAGYRQEWNVSVKWDGAVIQCRATTSLNQTLGLTGEGFDKTLLWTNLAPAIQNADRTQYYTVTSKQVSPSYVPLIAMIDRIKGVQLWMSKPLYADEHTRAYNNALDAFRVLSSNNIENALQMAKVEKLLPLDAAKLWRDAKSLKNSVFRRVSQAKALASLYLWYRYVAKTTYQDLEELLKAVPNLFPKTETVTLKGEKITTEREFEYPNYTWVAATARVSPYNLSLMALRLGVHPGLAQAWDLFPGTFVLDWFTGASEQLAAIDWFIYRSFFKLHWLLSTRKTVVMIDSSDLGGDGVVKATFYIRSVSLVWPRFLDSIPNPRCAPIKNWATAATALAISLYKAPGGPRN